MKVLLDECCPAPLKRALSGTNVFTVEMVGLKGVKNGKLIEEADGVYDVLITADKNLRYQQDLAKRKIAIIELPFNSWNKIRTMIPEIQTALDSIRAGQYVEVSAPSNNP